MAYDETTLNPKPHNPKTLALNPTTLNPKTLKPFFEAPGIDDARFFEELREAFQGPGTWASGAGFRVSGVGFRALGFRV